MDGTGHGEASSPWWASIRGLDPCNWLQHATRAFLRCLGFEYSAVDDPPKGEDKEGTEADGGVDTVGQTAVAQSLVVRARTPGRRSVAPGNGVVTNLRAT
ncbi:hypothetical protein Taro_025885 [Colocasia esculenta]|uniref:Uncharacterized protein n=1 Tax=Colocasia esculenta TaxID=4460 RepID=A0A843VPL6_COLES|nr:hypothetical protein [Colocasia esculenta]